MKNILRLLLKELEINKNYEIFKTFENNHNAQVVCWSGVL